MDPVEQMLLLLQDPDFDRIVYQAVERFAGITHKNKNQSIVFEYDVVEDDGVGPKTALLEKVRESIDVDCKDEKFFLDNGSMFTLSQKLMEKAEPFKNPYISEDKDNGRLCIERNEVYNAVRQAALDLDDDN